MEAYKPLRLDGRNVDQINQNKTMASFNQVTIIGNLTRDPEIRYTPKGSAVGDVSLAVNRKYKTDSGEAKEETTFVDCTAWGKTAELIGQYCKKGNPLFIVGRLQQDTWEDKATGQKRSKLKVVIENMQFLGGKSDGGERSQGQQTTQTARPPSAGYRQQDATPPPQGGDEDWSDTSIPF
jgi:single-strand DNA-binding protein